MKFFKKNIPVIFLFVFELIIGILLLISPEEFTRAVFIFFGAVLIAIGVIYLVRYLVEKKKGEETSVATLVISIVSLVIGIASASLSGVILKLLSMVWVIYGIILIVSGVYKARNYVEIRKNKDPGSFINIISIVISLALGVVLIINPFKVTVTMWRFAGIVLIIESFIDFALIMLPVRAQASDTAENKEN